MSFKEVTKRKIENGVEELLRSVGIHTTVILTQEPEYTFNDMKSLQSENEGLRTCIKDLESVINDINKVTKGII